MRRCSRNIAALLAAGLFLLPSAKTWAASAQPTSGWTIGPINAQSTSGNGFCSMKADYDNGTQVVFARDSRLSNSLAIEFSTKSLTPGKQYMVIAEAGLLSRQLNAIAATDKVLVMQMGRDQPFFDMLRQKDIMQISYDNTELSYSLKGTADAFQALAECVASNGKKNDAPVAAPMQQAYQETMASELDRLRAENKKLLLENQQAPQMYNDLDAVEAAEQLRALKKENARLKKQIATEKTPAAPAAKKPKPGAGLVASVLKKARITARDDDDAKVWQVENITASARLEAGAARLSAALRNRRLDSKSSCGGDFAMREAPVTRIGPYDAQTAEMACMGASGGDGAAALLFLSSGDDVAVITFEGAAEDVGQALDARSDFIAALK